MRGRRREAALEEDNKAGEEEEEGEQLVGEPGREDEVVMYRARRLVPLAELRLGMAR